MTATCPKTGQKTTLPRHSVVGKYITESIYKFLISNGYKSSEVKKAFKWQWVKNYGKNIIKNIDTHSVRDELKLNRADVGWYQIRKSLEKRNESGDYEPIIFIEFKEAYDRLTQKLRPLVYEYGFLMS